MFLLAMNALTLSTVLGDELCIDLEVGDKDYDWTDDEVNEESNDRVCAYQEGGYDDKVCRNGVKRDWRRGDLACFDFGRETLDKDKSFYIVTEGSDAVWIDRLNAWRYGGFWPEWEKEWGLNNSAGYCLSQDPNDHISWNNDDRDQHVPDDRCYYALRLDPNGDVHGYYDASVPTMCRETKKMDCKQNCPGGWEHVDTSNHGCCSSFGSCGGNMKVCAKDTECRRRTEGGVAALEEGDENWVLLYTPAKDASETANRLVHAESDLSQAEETDTKHFVLENGNWVQLSQERAKGMTIVDEADEVLPEVSEDARRRWSRFPGWPPYLQRCRDEMEMPCNMPCLGGWSLFVEMENGCCMNGPGGIDHPKPCGFTTKVCQKFYLCWD